MFERKIKLVCPICRKQLIPNEKSFQCHEHGVFQSYKDIPILVKELSNLDFYSFEEHWKKREGMQYARTKLKKAQDFIQPLENITGRSYILDAGCGDGIHANIVQKTYGDRFYYYGVDISLSAVSTAFSRNETGTFINADVQYLPFDDGVFDITISYGVLAYTSSPEKSFEELCRVTKNGGLMGVWFYPRGAGPSWQILKIVRFLVSVAPKFFVNILVNIIVPFMIVLPTSSKVNLFNATWAQCKEVILVNVAPEKLWYPKRNDIIELFDENNITILDSIEGENITVWGVKK